MGLQQIGDITPIGTGQFANGGSLKPLLRMQDGRFARADVAPDNSILLTVFNGDGTIYSAAVDTGLSNSGLSSRPPISLAEGSNGSILVGMSDLSWSSTVAVYWQWIADDGSGLGPPWSSNLENLEGLLNVKSAPLANGNTAVFWVSARASKSQTFTVSRAEFDESGNLVGNTELFSTGRHHSWNVTDWIETVELANGRHLITISNDGSNLFSATRKGFIMEQDGSVGPSFMFASTINGQKITALRDGGFLIHRLEQTPDQAPQLVLEKYGSSGRFQNKILTITGGSTPHVVELPDGRLLLAWEDSANQRYGTYAKIVDKNGNNPTQDFLITKTYDTIPRIQDIWIDEEGKLHFLLIGRINEDQSDAQFTIAFDPLNFEGSEGANRWVGGSRSDHMLGRGGADRFFGNGGADTLLGGAGDDWLEGGSGTDKIDGDIGSDTVSFRTLGRVELSLDGTLAATGGAEADTLISIENVEGTSSGGDRLRGSSTANTLWGLGGDDVLEGKNGDDILDGGKGADRLSGGEGSDSASYAKGGFVQVSLDGSLTKKGEAAGDTLSSIENIIGSIGGADTIAGNSGNNRLEGLSGNDRLFGRSGNDMILGGKGADTMDGGAGFDTVSYEDFSDKYLQGIGVTISLDDSLPGTEYANGDRFISIEGVIGTTNGRDTLSGNSAANRIIGLGGNDRLYGRDGNDKLYGGQGNDYIVAGLGNDFLDGGEGRDTASFIDEIAGLSARLVNGNAQIGKDILKSIEAIIGTNFDDRITGDSSNNSLSGMGGDDQLSGGDGNDTLRGGHGNNTLSGGNGNDRLIAGGSRDILEGGEGADTLTAVGGLAIASYSGDDAVVVALDGSVQAEGAAALDKLERINGLIGSDQGSDRLYGNHESNELWGSGGDDYLSGKSGEDFLFGGFGKDTLQGGQHTDYFVFFDAREGGDKIVDFGSSDWIALSGSSFGLKSESGELDPDVFVAQSSNRASDSNDRLIFRTTDKTLWFDDDGSGASGAVLICDLQNSYNLTAGDIFVF